MKYYLKKFRELTTEELYEIIRLRILVFVIEQNCPYDECDGKDYNAIHLFASENNTITAYARILPPGVSFKEPSIGRVVVNSKYRSKGLAKEIMNRAVEYIKTEMNETSIKIEAQCYLERFYTDLGFNAISDTFMLDNIPHVEMLLS
jgi:ElaA protein